MTHVCKFVRHYEKKKVMGVDRNEVKKQGKYRGSFLDSFIFNLCETYYHPSTVVENWNITFILLTSSETFIIEEILIGNERVCVPMGACLIFTLDVS